MGVGTPPLRHPWVVFAWAGMLAVLILWAVYPGFMSYDSLHALREARGAVQGGPYPPFVSYVWRALDAVFPGPAPMLLLQNLVLLASLAAFFVLAGVGRTIALVGLTLAAAAPPLLGPMLVVWKDVALSACFAAGAALLFLQESRPSARPAPLLLAAVALVFCGMAYRMNAAPGALPLLVWAASLARPRGGSVRLVPALIAGVALTAGLSALVFMINTYRLPDFSRLGVNTSVPAVQVYDLIGVTALSGRAAFTAPGVDEATLVRQATQSFDPRHLNITMAADRSGIFLRYLDKTPPGEIAATWWTAVTSRPGAYLAHRWAVFRELVGLAPREVFYPTHGTVDANEFGYEHRPGRASDRVLRYIERACGPPSSGSLSCRTWAYHLAGLAATLACVLLASRTHRVAAIAVYASGLAYLLPQFVVTPAADLRYTQWSVVASLLACVIAAGALRSRTATRRRT